MRILIGVDGSSQALAGARWVAGLPLTESDEVIVAAMAQQPVLVGNWGYILTPATSAALDATWEEVRQAARRTADTGVEALGSLGCVVRTVVRDGHPVDGLTRIAQETAADLIVVGPHGRGRLDKILLGSVSQGLLHRMPAAVLVAREPVSRPVRVLLATDGSSPSLAAGGYLARFPLPTGRASRGPCGACCDTIGLRHPRSGPGRARPSTSRSRPSPPLAGTPRRSSATGTRSARPLRPRASSVPTCSSRISGPRRLRRPRARERLAGARQGRPMLRARRP